MSSSTSTLGELLAMDIADLGRDLRQQRTAVAKMRMDIEMRKEKDTARYRRERRYLALLETAIARKRADALHAQQNSSTVPARRSQPLDAARGKKSGS